MNFKKEDFEQKSAEKFLMPAIIERKRKVYLSTFYKQNNNNYFYLNES
jgi:hypothetical protein